MKIQETCTDGREEMTAQRHQFFMARAIHFVLSLSKSQQTFKLGNVTLEFVRNSK